MEMSRDAVEGLELLDLLGNLRPRGAAISVREYLLKCVNLGLELAGDHSLILSETVLGVGCEGEFA